MSQLKVHRCGREGKGILWIHGYTLDGTIWTRIWSLLPGYRHVAIDLPAHGGSSCPMPRELPVLARSILDLALAEDLRNLVGMSFGGLVAMQVAIEGGAAIDTMTLASPALGGGPQDPESAQCNIELMRMAQERGVGPWLRERWMSCPPRIFEGASKNPSLFHELHQIVGQHRFEELTDGAMRGLAAHAQTPRALGQVQAKAMLLIGEGDMESFRRSAELIRRSMRLCRRQYVEDAGHMALLERPESCAGYIQEFLAGTD